MFHNLDAKTIEESGLEEQQRAELTKISITAENYFKIGLIYLRICARLPVVLLGETGIGKTSLIVLMSKIMDSELRIKNVHAGTKAQEIVQSVKEANDKLINLQGND
jgi:MoxR-like ATPase